MLEARLYTVPGRDFRSFQEPLRERSVGMTRSNLTRASTAQRRYGRRVWKAGAVTFLIALALYVQAAFCRAWGKYGIHARHMDQAAIQLFTKPLAHVSALRRLWDSVL